MRKLRTPLCLVLCAAMIFTAACSSGNEPAESTTQASTEAAPTEAVSTEAASTETAQTEAAPTEAETESLTEAPAPVEEITTLTYFTGHGQITNADLAGLYKWQADYMRDNLGIEFEIREMAGADRAQVVQAMLAARDMTDIWVPVSMVTADQAADAGLLMDLNTKKDIMPNLFGEAIFEPMTRYLSDINDGTLPYLLSYVGRTELASNLPKVRWDLYQQLGYPEINTLEDMIPLFQQMLELEPERPDGSKNYGLGLFTVWDGMYGPQFVHYLEGLFGRNYTPNYFVQIDKDGSMTSRFEKTSYMYRCINFFYLCNQAGVLDPDSLTQTWEAYDAKTQNGSYMYAFWPWHGSSNILQMTRDLVEGRQGYAPVVINDAALTINPDNPIGGQSRIFAVGVDAPDAACRLMDYIFSYEGSDMLTNLAEGVLWELDENGQRRGFMEGEPGYKTAEEIRELGWTGGNFFGGESLNTHEIIPQYGDTIGRGYWEPNIRQAIEAAVDPILEDWRGHYGVMTNEEFVASLPSTFKVDPAVSFVPTPSEDMDMIMSSIGDVAKTNIYQMIFAADQSEFDALWDDMIVKAEALGLQTVLDWTYAEWDRARTLVDQYS